MHKFIRNTVGPLLLLLSCPPFVMVMWYTNTKLSGSFLQFWQMIVAQGFWGTLQSIWVPVMFGSLLAWKIIAVFVIFQALLLKLLPGKEVVGPLTAQGNSPPQYRANGLLALIISLLAFSGASYGAHLFSPTLIYDNFGAILGALNCLSLLLCFMLYLKGRFWPSSNDSGMSGNFILDYYWGTELYPVIAGINLKMFINCRLGMMSWAVILISYAAKQQVLFGLSNSMIVAVSLQLIYIAKFFIWESGYLASLDIMHDRAGFYICWGCLVWVPCIYTSAAMYLVLHPHHLSGLLAACIFIAGVLCISMNYAADRQRQSVRALDGHCQIWGKTPRLIRAYYCTDKGEKKHALLLCSGWWGVSRHFHYLPELLAAFFWSVPALFYDFSPYFYVCFLTILLFDRAFRDDKRCADKYGEYWERYCSMVPYKIIPFVI